MPNKNIKKRKRVVMTSDVVPVGSRDDLSTPEPSTGDATTTDETETSPLVTEMTAPGGAAPAETAPAETAPSEALGASKDEESSTVDPAATASVAAGATPEATDGEATEGGATDGEVFSAKESAGDDGSEPAAKGDELWSDESEPPASTAAAVDVSRAHLKGLIEALVFVADQPLSLNDIAKAAGRADRKLVKALAEELRQDYARRGVHLDEVAGGLIFRTNPAYAPFIRDAAAKKPVRMTRAQLETLSIIAYRQPLTRPEVDDVRGVDSGPVMKMLLERGLIKILGKKDEPGRPLLYGTTPAFLEFFGLKALKDLPSLREFTELSDDSRRMYDREMGDSPDAPTDPDLATLAAAASAAGAVARPEDGADPDAARPEDGADPNADPRTLRPGAHGTGDWFDPPTEPDTTVSALEPELSETPDPTGKPAQGSSEGSA